MENQLLIICWVLCVNEDLEKEIQCGNLENEYASFSNAVSLLRVLYLVFDILFEVTIFLSFKTVSTVIFRKEKKGKKIKKEKT